ncbi:MAG: hypothetical protein V1838_03620, partial [Patescibacteria group bacterium]
AGVIWGTDLIIKNESVSETINTTVSKTTDTAVVPDRQYNWSTMNEGPYHDAISFATSPDLLSWIDTGRLLVNHASVPDAVIKDGEIFLYFVDVSTDGIPEQIGLLRSTDNGTIWSDKVDITINGLANKVPVDPCPLLLADGRIRLYYLDMSTAAGPEGIGSGIANRIYSAISSDGINFTQEEGYRYAQEGIFDPSVIKYGDTYRMYVGDANGQNVYLATSTDGLNFTKVGIAYSGGAIPEVIYAFETYFLFTGGINIASSNDGVIFTSLPDRFESTINPLTADPSVIVLDDGTYLMFYKTRE